MPHSIRASADPISTYSVDHMGPKPSKSSPQLGVPSTSSNRTSRQSLSRGESRSGPHAYVDRVGTGNLDEFLQKHLGSKDSMIANYNNSSQQRKQYYEEHFQYKDNHHGSVRERVQRVAPVIAELRTNVIVGLVLMPKPMHCLTRQIDQRRIHSRDRFVLSSRRALYET